MKTYRWIRHDGRFLRSIGILRNGKLYNPNGYPEEVVRAALAAMDEWHRERRKQGAKKATARRQKRRVSGERE
jgi:hypothetical protein